MLCPSNNGKHALPWGSAQFIGLGFSVWITIIIIERFGAPLMKSCAVVLGLVVGIIISAACGYFDNSAIDAAPVATFIWVKTFKLSVSGPIVLPFLAVFLILMMEAIGDITATCDVSRYEIQRNFPLTFSSVEVEGDIYDSRIQGGILADGNSISNLANQRSQWLSCWSLYNHSHVHLCAKQRGHLTDPLCQSQSGLLLLFLPLHHGSILQIRGRLRCYPLCCPRWNDHIPFHCRCRLRYQNSRYLRILPTKPLHYDVCLVRRCRRYPRA